MAKTNSKTSFNNRVRKFSRLLHDRGRIVDIFRRPGDNRTLLRFPYCDRIVIEPSQSDATWSVYVAYSSSNGVFHVGCVLLTADITSNAVYVDGLIACINTWISLPDERKVMMPLADAVMQYMTMWGSEHGK